MTAKLQRIVWYSCDIDFVHPVIDVDDQTRKALEKVLLGLIDRIRKEKVFRLPAEITVDLETEHWSSKFVAKVKYDCGEGNSDESIQEAL